jgi:hypothetical protein
MWKEQFMAYFKAMSRYFIVEAEERRKEPHERESLDRDMNPRPQENEAALVKIKSNVFS